MGKKKRGGKKGKIADSTSDERSIEAQGPKSLTKETGKFDMRRIDETDFRIEKKQELIKLTITPSAISPSVDVETISKGPYFRYLKPIDFTQPTAQVAEKLLYSLTSLLRVFEETRFNCFRLKYRIILYEDPDEKGVFHLFLEVDPVTWFKYLKEHPGDDDPLDVANNYCENPPREMMPPRSAFTAVDKAPNRSTFKGFQECKSKECNFRLYNDVFVNGEELSNVGLPFNEDFPVIRRSTPVSELLILASLEKLTSSSPLETPTCSTNSMLSQDEDFLFYAVQFAQAVSVQTGHFPFSMSFNFGEWESQTASDFKYTCHGHFHVMLLAESSHMFGFMKNRQRPPHNYLSDNINELSLFILRPTIKFYLEQLRAELNARIDNLESRFKDLKEEFERFKKDFESFRRETNFKFNIILVALVFLIVVVSLQAYVVFTRL